MIQMTMLFAFMVIEIDEIFYIVMGSYVLYVLWKSNISSSLH